MRQHCFPRDRGSKPYSVGKSTKVVNLKHKGMKKNRLHSDLVCKQTKSNINFQKTKIIFFIYRLPVHAGPVRFGASTEQPSALEGRADHRKANHVRGGKANRLSVCI